MNVWTQVDAAGNCGWMCEPIPTYTQPSRADQIQDFAQGFIRHCDADQSNSLKKKEIKKCLKMLNKMTKE
jgi:hypothetical protein